MKNEEQIIKELQEENRKLKEENKKLQHEKQKIEKEFEEFKAKHNSTVEELRKAMHLRPNLSIKKSGLGAKKNHKAYIRHVPERIDHIKKVILDKCPKCNHELPKESSETRERYSTDIEFVIKTVNTKYIIPRKYCKICKKIVEPTIHEVLPHARFGLKLMLFVMYLRIALRLPVNKVQEFLKTICNLSISEGEIILIGYQLAKAFGPYYKTLENLLKLARVKHSDITSWRTEAKNYSAWVFISAGVVLYKITRRGNAKVPLKLFGNKQQGKFLVVDRASVFRSLAEAVGFILQFCWAHILQDTKDLAKNFGIEGKYIHRKLKQIFHDADDLNHEGTEAQVMKLKKRVEQLTKRHYKHKTIFRFVNNLAKRDLNGLFLFVTDKDVDPTNNISEQKLRQLVIFRKITNGSRSVKGAETTAILFSIIETLKYQCKNVLDGLYETIRASRT